MKHLLISFFLLALSTSVFAHPGSSTLTCKSEDKHGLKQSLELFIKRANGIGWGSPMIELTVNGNKSELSTPDDMSNYGETFHNSPLKVIRVSVSVEESEVPSSASFSVVAIPQSVKAFDEEGKPVKWSLEAENDECYDVHGKANFKGVIRGYIQKDDSFIQLDAQILDCSLVYNPGMSC